MNQRMIEWITLENKWWQQESGLEFENAMFQSNIKIMTHSDARFLWKNKQENELAVEETVNASACLLKTEYMQIIS